MSDNYTVADMFGSWSSPERTKMLNMTREEKKEYFGYDWEYYWGPTK